MKQRSSTPFVTVTCTIGQKVQNVGGKWYIKGGTFCCRCLRAYDNGESYQIYLYDKKIGRIHGIPKCPICGQPLRTRSKPNHQSGFWDSLKEMEGK